VWPGRGAVSDDPIERLRRRIAGAAKLPTSALGRARRTAAVALKVGLGRLTGKGDAEVFEQARMRLPAKLLFLFRIRFGLHSELARLKSVADWAALEERLCT